MRRRVIFNNISNFQQDEDPVVLSNDKSFLNLDNLNDGPIDRGFKTVFASLIITLIFILLMSSVMVLVVGGVDTDDVDSVRYVSNDPIVINSDTELSQIANMEGWRGDGSGSDPYIIEQLDINGIQDGFCIFVGNTSLHLIIQDCYLHDSYDTDNYLLTITNATNITIRDSELGPSESRGLRIYESSYIDLHNITIRNTPFAIYTRLSSYVTYTKCTLINNDEDVIVGLAIFECQSLEISDSQFLRNKVGINILDSENINIFNNTLVDALQVSVLFDDTINVNMKDNSMTGKGIHISGFRKEHFTTHDIDSSNQVRGMPVIYLKNRTGGSYTSPLGQLILANCSDFRVDGLSIDDVVTGLIAGFCDSIYLSNLSISNTSREGISLIRVKSATLENVQLTNTGEYGLYCVGLKFERIFLDRCVINNSGQGDRYSSSHKDGIYIINYLGGSLKNSSISYSVENGVRLEKSSSFDISNNVIANSQVGLMLKMTGGSTYVYFNQFINNTDSGIHLISNSGTLDVIHNTFLENNYDRSSDFYNGPQASSEDDRVNWDDGQEGNYWSDYSRRYPDANNDGMVWDEPYLIEVSGGVQDNYPLVSLIDHVGPIARAGPDREIDEDTPTTLDGTGSFDHIGIRSYNWTIYDSIGIQHLIGPVLEYTFVNPGIYNVTLLVEDLSSNSDTDTLMITVRDITPPEASAGENILIEIGSLVQFDGTGSTDNDGIVNWTWSFLYNGSDHRLFGPEPIFTFEQIGEYQVSLKVTDTSGLSSVDLMLVRVIDTTPPVANAGNDIFIDPHVEITLDGSSSSDNDGILSWNWSFLYEGLLMTFEGSHVSFIFDFEGQYEITLNVSDPSGNWDTDLLYVDVGDISSPIADAGIDMTIDQGSIVKLDGSNSSDVIEITLWIWNFSENGSDVKLNGISPSYSFTNPGSYKVTLTITNEAGKTDHDEVIIIVKDALNPIADAGNDMKIKLGEIASFDGSDSTDNVAIINWSWSFDHNGKTIILYGPVTTFLFESPGEYEIELTVVDQEGLSDSEMIIITVHETSDNEPDYFLLITVFFIIIIIVVFSIIYFYNRRNT